MNEFIPLYEWVRGERSIHVAQITTAQRQTAPPEQKSISDENDEEEEEEEEEAEETTSTDGKETVLVELIIRQTRWGTPGEPTRRATVVRPASETARLKFPDPVWGRVDLEPGILPPIVYDIYKLIMIYKRTEMIVLFFVWRDVSKSYLRKSVQIPHSDINFWNI